jgi:hypothetical protein
MLLIAGGTDDFKLPEVQFIFQHLKNVNLEFRLISQAVDVSYQELESEIIECTQYYLIGGIEFNSSTWLSHCTTFAYSLTPRPELFFTPILGIKYPLYFNSIQNSFTLISNETELSHKMP